MEGMPSKPAPTCTVTMQPVTAQITIPSPMRRHARLRRPCWAATANTTSDDRPRHTA